MKNLMAKCFRSAAVAAQAAHAGLITGDVGFTGGVTIDASSMGTATEITGWINPVVSPGPPTGTFGMAPYALTPFMPVTFTSQAWAFSGNTPTAFTWSFTSQDPKVGANPDNWTFSAAALSQNSNGEPVLVNSRITNATVLIWSDPTFGLQVATNVTGIYSNVPGATSPYTNSSTGALRFFRLKQP